MSPGANGLLSVDLGDLHGADAVLVQLEAPLEVAERAAARATGLFCLNAAPARELSPVLVGRCDLIVANDVERAAIPGLERASLLAVTHGATGATLYERGREVARARPPSVRAVDTVGSGDAFTAALSVALAEGQDPPAALAFACFAGALATTRRGAQAALPVREEVDAWLEGR